MPSVHRTPEGRYHPDPEATVPWTVRDARGFPVVGPPCDACGACECVPCECHGEPIHERGCVGLSFAYVRPEPWSALCEACASREGLRVIDCQCSESSGWDRGSGTGDVSIHSA